MMKHTYVTAPHYRAGTGWVVKFEGGGRKIENMPIKHHFRLESTFFAVDGCVMAEFEPDDAVVCRVKWEFVDFMETSSE